MTLMIHLETKAVAIDRLPVRELHFTCTFKVCNERLLVHLDDFAIPLTLVDDEADALTAMRLDLVANLYDVFYAFHFVSSSKDFGKPFVFLVSTLYHVSGSM